MQLLQLLLWRWLWLWLWLWLLLRTQAGILHSGIPVLLLWEPGGVNATLTSLPSSWPCHHLPVVGGCTDSAATLMDGVAATSPGTTHCLLDRGQTWAGDAMRWVWAAAAGRVADTSEATSPISNSEARIRFAGGGIVLGSEVSLRWSSWGLPLRFRMSLHPLFLLLLLRDNSRGPLVRGLYAKVGFSGGGCGRVCVKHPLLLLLLLLLLGLMQRV